MVIITVTVHYIVCSVLVVVNTTYKSNLTERHVLHNSWLIILTSVYVHIASNVLAFYEQKFLRISVLVKSLNISVFTCALCGCICRYIVNLTGSTVNTDKGITFFLAYLQRVALIINGCTENFTVL